MKYTAEELYNWCLENGYREQIVETQYFNDKGFLARTLDGELVKKENQYYYRATITDGYEIEEPMGDGSEQINAVLDKVKAHPEVMSAAIVTYKKRFRLFTAFGENEVEKMQELDKKVILCMFDLLEIDTQGKVRKLMEGSRYVKASRQAMNSVSQGLKKMRENE